MNVRFEVGNLTKMAVDAIVNPANSEGEMGGGVAAAIKRAGGKRIEREAMERAPIAIGDAVVTTSGRLKCDHVIHAPTMMTPVQRTSVEKIYKAVQASLRAASELDLRSVAIPGMGTGTGRVPIEDAADAMVEAIRAADFSAEPIDEVIIVDHNKQLLQALEQSWQAETEAEAGDGHSEEDQAN